MPETLNVERRFWRFNQLSDDAAAAVAVHRATLAPDVFQEWCDAQFGGENALFLIGTSRFEIFAGKDPATAVGGWTARNGLLWDPIQWTVDDLDAALQAVAERSIRVTDRTAHYGFNHPSTATREPSGTGSGSAITPSSSSRHGRYRSPVTDARRSGPTRRRSSSRAGSLPHPSGTSVDGDAGTERWAIDRDLLES